MSPALLLLLTGCADVDPGIYEGVEVEDAWLEGLRLSTMSMVLGFVRGQAELVVRGPEGQEVSGPVTLTGGTAGLSADLILTEFPLADVPLSLPPEPLYGEQLLGRYTGSSMSLVTAVGVETHHLENEHGVRIDQASLAIGAGMMIAREWLTLEPGELEADDAGDTGDTGGR